VEAKDLDLLRPFKATRQILLTRNELTPHPNRTGEYVSAGLSRATASMWLLESDDDTAL